MVLVEGEDALASKVEGEGVHVAEVQHHLLRARRDLRVLERAEGGGRAGVQEHGWQARRQAVHQWTGAGQVVRQLFR